MTDQMLTQTIGPIALDIDGVLAHFTPAFAKLLRKFGAELRPFETPDHEPTMWDWEVAYGATPEQRKLAWEWVTGHPAWWSSLAVHPDCGPRVRTLLSAWDFPDTLCITKRHHYARPWTRDWLRAWGFPSTVITCQRAKVEMLLALEPSIVVEDKPETLRDYRDKLLWRNKKAHLLLVNRSYNAGFLDMVGIERVESTEQALERCLTLGGQR